MKLQTYFETAGKWSCLALCYLYSFIDKYLDGSEETKNRLLAALLLDAYVRGAGVDKEFFVYDPVCLLTREATDFNIKLKVDIKKKPITAIADLDEHMYNAVEFKYGNNSHFVLYSGREFIYDSLADSKCFKYGKPVSVREINYVS